MRIPTVMTSTLASASLCGVGESSAPGLVRVRAAGAILGVAARNCLLATSATGSRVVAGVWTGVDLPTRRGGVARRRPRRGLQLPSPCSSWTTGGFSRPSPDSSTTSPPGVATPRGRRDGSVRQLRGGRQRRPDRLRPRRPRRRVRPRRRQRLRPRRRPARGRPRAHRREGARAAPLPRARAPASPTTASSGAASSRPVFNPSRRPTRPRTACRAPWCEARRPRRAPSRCALTGRC